MILAGLIGAAALSLGGVERLISFGDYPDDALEKNQSAAALLEVIVGPDGKVIGCSVVNVAGSRKLAEHMCKIVGRKKIPPATLGDGTPAYSRLRMVFRMVVPGEDGRSYAAGARQSAEQVLIAANLPAHLTNKVADVVLAIGAGGNVLDCAPTAVTENRAVAAAACKAKSNLLVQPLVLPNGNKPVFVANMRVAFQLDAK